MKNTDSRPPFQPTRRHYHRFREEDQDGWATWVGGTRRRSRSRSSSSPILSKSQKSGIKWAIVLGILAFAGFIWLLYYQLL
ncbi:MAG: hypothetical protein EAZ65_03305 [Verrucomicrobia bacterium]|nr:MAG: hypothetical protein EAZ84_05965 [Verrucomicrobiota bacterium]TAE88406.1 MAG: hypothetical protein EAZ82_03995 [Verrucomicrobiota bacterium]TAF26859.1 MAG: hypothetical protein EAZ71_03300 [Verrucomicrobiota bacterium]TAF42117.1 MAG: hypothetical protein EAZ65_03305 [Verrucomicrobiota bacterium]